MVAFDDPVRCVSALAIATKARAQQLPVDQDRADHVRPELLVHSFAAGETLDEVTSKSLLRLYGLDVVSEVAFASPAEANFVVDQIGLPAVVKLRAKDLAHKSDVGGVLTGRSSVEAVASAAHHLLALAANLGLGAADLVAAEHVDIAYELIVGSIVDPIFGPVLTVGVGGVFAEAIDDVIVLLPDFELSELEVALEHLHHKKLLEGHRGLPAVTAQSVEPALRAVAAAATDERLGIYSIDVNPLAVCRNGRLVAVDALIELRPASDW